ncbi:MAG: glycosyltransferase family 9 protein [Bdellovibrionales bacterium]
MKYQTSRYKAIGVLYYSYMSNDTTAKILIIRFSSFGDILQGLPVTDIIKTEWPQAQIHWVTREEYAPVLQEHSKIDQIWPFSRNLGLWGLFRLGTQLRAQNFTHVYDAHNNLRSLLLQPLLRCKWKSPLYLVRSKFRIRRLFLFQFRKNYFPKPFVGAKSYVTPLQKWGLSISNLKPSFQVSPQLLENTQKSHQIPHHSIVLVPSAAWPMKTWPKDYWISLIQSLLKTSHPLVLLGGKGDAVCFELAEMFSNTRLVNLAGRLTLEESCAVIQKARQVISADTGLMHAADQMGVSTLALIGPTAFGHPLFPNSLPLEVALPCKPCSKDGRGTCIQAVYQKCLRDITPEQVLKHIPTFS